VPLPILCRPYFFIGNLPREGRRVIEQTGDCFRQTAEAANLRSQSTLTPLAALDLREFSA
jgi:hypothetical protein